MNGSIGEEADHSTQGSIDNHLGIDVGVVLVPWGEG